MSMRRAQASATRGARAVLNVEDLGSGGRLYTLRRAATDALPGYAAVWTLDRSMKFVISARG